MTDWELVRGWLAVHGDSTLVEIANGLAMGRLRALHALTTDGSGKVGQLQRKVEAEMSAVTLELTDAERQALRRCVRREINRLQKTIRECTKPSAIAELEFVDSRLADTMANGVEECRAEIDKLEAIVARLR